MHSVLDAKIVASSLFRSSFHPTVAHNVWLVTMAANGTEVNCTYMCPTVMDSPQSAALWLLGGSRTRCC